MEFTCILYTNTFPVGRHWDFKWSPNTGYTVCFTNEQRLDVTDFSTQHTACDYL